MIVLRLGGADISLTRAFIPLWVADGILLVGILFVACLNMRDECTVSAMALFAFCVVAMLPLFKIFLAASDAGTLTMSMRTMCIPLFIFFGLACLGLSVVAFLIGAHHENDD